MKKDLAIDVDGVILDSMIVFAEVYNDIFENTKGFIPKTKQDVKRWDFYKDWDFIDKNAIWGIFDKVREQELYVPIIDKLIPKFLKKMRKNNVLDIVTGRDEKWNDSLLIKLRKHGIIEEIHYDSIHVTGRDKNNKLELGYDIYVDDNPNMAIKLQELNKNRGKNYWQFLFLFDQPWNQNVRNGLGVIRTYSWRDLWKKMRLVL